MKTKTSKCTIGIDLGDKKHAVCVLDAQGQIIRKEAIINDRDSLTAPSGR